MDWLLAGDGKLKTVIKIILIVMAVQLVFFFGAVGITEYVLDSGKCYEANPTSSAIMQAYGRPVAYLYSLLINFFIYPIVIGLFYFIHAMMGMALKGKEALTPKENSLINIVMFVPFVPLIIYSLNLLFMDFLHDFATLLSVIR